jgi:uncharacterized membrane protein YphA (DoxX/SURF4 family)
MATGSSGGTRATDVALLVLRIGFAALLIGLHGWGRSMRAWNYLVHGQPWTFVDLVGRIGFPFPAVFAILSVAAESIGALLIIPGFLTRFAAFAVVFNFAVAVYSESSKGDPFELPGLYLLCAVTILIAGAGRLSIDGRR